MKERRPAKIGSRATMAIEMLVTEIGRSADLKFLKKHPTWKTLLAAC